MEAPLISWADVERERAARQLAPNGAVEPAAYREALAIARRVRTPEVRDWAMLWVPYCLTTDGVRPAYPLHHEGKVRALRLRFARLGVVDPQGEAFGADLLRRSCPRRKASAARGVDAAGAFRDGAGAWLAPY